MVQRKRKLFQTLPFCHNILDGSCVMIDAVSYVSKETNRVVDGYL
jgi:hypothetical protein